MAIFDRKWRFEFRYTPSSSSQEQQDFSQTHPGTISILVREKQTLFGFCIRLKKIEERALLSGRENLERDVATLRKKLEEEAPWTLPSFEYFLDRVRADPEGSLTTWN